MFGANRAAFFIFVTVVLDIIGLMIIFPIMPDILRLVGKLTISDAAVWGGILYASYALMQFLFSPIIGNLSDTFGRRPIILTALGLMAVDYLILGFASVLWVFIIGRMVGGVAGGTVPTAFAYLADISTSEDKAKNFGLVGAAFGVGFVLGPFLGGILGEIDFRLPFFFSAGLSFLTFLLCFFYLPESLNSGKRRKFRLKDLNPFASLAKAFIFRDLRIMFLCFFVISVAHWVYPAIWSFWSKEVFNWGPGLIGGSLACYGLGVAFVQGFVIRMKFVNHLGPKKVVFFSLVVGAVALTGFGFANAAWMVFALIPIAVMSELMNPTLDSFVSNQVSDSKQGLLQGILSSINAITSVISPLIMTLLFKIGTIGDRHFHFPGVPFLFAAILLLAIIYPLLKSMKSLEKDSQLREKLM
ncbi:MAG: TCR/Tet family MFS transporter [Pseudomonadota bacterium]|nr:TCR/Tet family MFS transporter [Pseudomonadota bacterium]